MTQQDMKPMLISVLMAVLVLFSALSFSYVEIERRDERQAEQNKRLNQQVAILEKENSTLRTEQQSNEALMEKYKLLEQVISVSQMEGSQLERAVEISRETPLDLKSALVLVSYADKYHVKPSLILSMIKRESNFDAFLVGTHHDRGFLQIIPGTEKWLAKTYGKDMGIEYDPSKIFTPEYNLGLGIRYIAELLHQYKDPHRALSEYNRGPNKLAAYYAENNTYQTGYSKTIVSQEKNYIQFDGPVLND